MRHHLRLTALVVAATALTACGSGGSSVPAGAANTVASTARPATEATVGATDPGGDQPAPDDSTVVIDIGAMPTAVPTEPCALLTPEQLSTVLTGPDGGAPTVTPAAATCEWNDDAGTTVLELLVFDTMGEDMSGITPDMLIQMRGSEHPESITPVDIGGLPAIGGPEGDDAFVQWLMPSGLYQLHLWAVGNAVRPATEWATLQPRLVALAEAIVARMS